MSFIKEVAPFIERIELHVEGKGRFSNREELIKVRDIHFEYIRKKDFKTPTDINCSSCLRHMMTQLKGEIGRQKAKGVKMTFPRIERPITEDEKLEVIIEAVNSVKPVLVWDDDYKSMKWGAFKKYCTAKGLTVPKKTRKQLEAELKEL